MSSRLRWIAVGALALLLLLGLFARSDSRELTATSFGSIPAGYAAVYALLERLDLPVSRSYEPPERLPVTATVWWIAPDRLCAKAGVDDPSDRFAGLDDWALGPWLHFGGTGVIFLPPEHHACLAEATLAGHAVPSRSRADGAETSDPGLDEESLVRGELPQPRVLEGEPLWRFSEAAARDDHWRVFARLDDAPFVVERDVGSGRLVLVADARVFTNRRLDAGDAGPFAVDLALAFGVPRFDEREHGLRDTPGAVLFLAGSPALALFLGLAALGALYAWHGTAWPPRRDAAEHPEPPTLEHFVDSLATLYARSGDTARVFERYRDFAASQIRRALRLPHDLPLARVLEIARGAGASREGIAMLEGRATITDARSLREAARALDAVVETVAGEAPWTRWT